jgi:predicted permease
LILSLLANAAVPTMLAGLNGAPTSLDLGIDLPVLSFCLVVTLLTGLLCGLIPALRLFGMKPAEALKTAAGGARSGHRLAPGRALVVVQVALSLVLLITAGLFLRTLHNLQAVELGFDAEHVAVFSIDPTLNEYHEERLLQLYSEMEERLRGIPGVSAVGVTPFPPASGSGSWLWLNLPNVRRTVAYIAFTDEGFFDALRIPLLAGRQLQVHDDAEAPPVALVNRHLAQRLGNNAVGQRIRLGGGEMVFEVTIVGVVEDIRDVGLRGDPQLSVFLPFRQRMEHVEAMTFLLRGSRSGEALLAEAREVVAGIDPDLPLYQAGLLNDQIDDTMLEERVFTLLSSLGAVLALVLACIGLYGTLSYTVSLRTTELGVRVALGARSADIVRSVMREMELVAAGAAIGLGAALAVTQVLANRLFQLSASDPLTIAGATVLLLVVAAVTTYLPARRAARVDPAEVLRFE